MRHVRQFSVLLLVVLGASVAFAADRVRLAQTTQPAPLPAPQFTPQLLPQSSTCALNCDMQAMNCANSCSGNRPPAGSTRSR